MNMLSVKPSPNLCLHRTVDGVFLGSRGDYRPTTFSPIIQFVLQASEHAQLSLFIFSTVCCHPFRITSSWGRFNQRSESGNGKRRYHVEAIRALAVAINTGTNLPSVATPNGQLRSCSC